MTDIRSKAEQDRNWLEQILHQVPGFRGYLEKEERRSTDKLLREFLAQRVDRCRDRMDGLMRALADDGKLALTEKVDRVKRATERVMRRLQFASYGYSGLFDAIKIREAELDQLYAFDLALIERINRLEERVAALEKTTGDADEIESATTELIQLVREFDEHLDGREKLIATSNAAEETGR